MAESPQKKDGILKVVLHVLLFTIVVFTGVFFYAKTAVHQKKIYSLIVLGRTQQNLDSFRGLQRAKLVYEKLEGLDQKHPFVHIHLAEISHSLWRFHDKKENHYNEFLKRFGNLATMLPAKLLNGLSSYHALKGLVEYEKGKQLQQKGQVSEAKSLFETAHKTLTEKAKTLSLHARLRWVLGLLLEEMGKPRYATQNFKRAAELGWQNPMFRLRLAESYLRQRKFSVAHHEFGKTNEQSKQNKSVVRGVLADLNNMRNSYCWIDPPYLLGSSAPKGLQLEVKDLITDALGAIVKGGTVPKCIFHPAFLSSYPVSRHNLMASIGDAVAVFDSGVGLSSAYLMVQKVLGNVVKVKKEGNLSPRVEAWVAYLQAKQAWYQKKFDKAAEFIEVAHKLSSEDAYILALKGLVHGQKKEYDKALSSLKKAFQYDPTLMQPFFDSAELYLSSKGQEDQVQKILDEMKKSFGESTDYHYLLGRLQSNQGKEEEAVKSWLKAIELDPAGDHYGAHFELGKYYFLKGDKVVVQVRKGLKWEPRKTFPKSNFEEWHKEFKVVEDKLRAKLKEKVIKKEDREKELSNFTQFLEALGNKKTIRPEAMRRYLGDLLEYYLEKAGSALKTALAGRPGASEPRFWIGKIYFKSREYAQCSGPFKIAAAGYLRDLEDEQAIVSYQYYARSILYGGGEKAKLKEMVEKVEKDFKTQAFFKINSSFLKLRTEKAKLLAKNKREEAKKVKLSEEDMSKLQRNLSALSQATKKISVLSALSQTLSEEAEQVKKLGVMAWMQTRKSNLQEDPNAKKTATPKAKKRRGRRRR